MSEAIEEPAKARRATVNFERAWSFVLLRPAGTFFVLSLLFGSIIVFTNPPFRGHDEQAHFVRVLSYAQGEIRPAAEIDGRQGTYLPRRLYEPYHFFDDARHRFRSENIRYGEIMEEFSRRTEEFHDETANVLVFAPLGGTEGYNLVSYLPYILAALIAQILPLDFLSLIYLMRWLGLLFFTLVATYAIAVVPVLKWAFVLIAMLPAALYARAVISADAAALSYTLAIAAVCLGAAQRAIAGRAWERAVWMTLCVLSKQPQIAFVLLEGMTARLRELPRRWRTTALVVLPGLILSPLWIYAVSAEIAVWRIQAGLQRPPEHFDLLWKLRFLWENPLHFPQVLWTSLATGYPDLWQQLIGVLGWLDVPVWFWLYPTLTLLLFASSLERLALDGSARMRVALLSLLIIIGYGLAVYLIFFITWTPPDSAHIWGVQGRYFVVLLPVAAFLVAALANLQLPKKSLAVVAIGGSILAGVASAEAMLRVHW